MPLALPCCCDKQNMLHSGQLNHCCFRTLTGIPPFTMKALAAATLGLQWLDIMVMLYEGMFWLHYGCVMAAAMAAVPARREKTCL